LVLPVCGLYGFGAFLLLAGCGFSFAFLKIALLLKGQCHKMVSEKRP
jgi:hypothetical protein